MTGFWEYAVYDAERILFGQMLLLPYSELMSRGGGSKPLYRPGSAQIHLTVTTHHTRASKTLPTDITSTTAIAMFAETLGNVHHYNVAHCQKLKSYIQYIYIYIYLSCRASPHGSYFISGMDPFTSAALY
jgi:hypothetical protein